MNPHLREITHRYELQRLLRSSPAASVFAAVDTETGDEVAVKLITTDGSPDETLVREPVLARIAALQEIDTPSLPRVRDGGYTTTGSAFLVLESVDIEEADAIRGLPRPQRLDLLAGVVDALAEMARRGLHHGRLSPDNVRLTCTQPRRLVLLGLNIRTLQPDVDAAKEPRHSLRQLAVLASNLLELPLGDNGIELSAESRQELPQATILKLLLDRCLQDEGTPPPFSELARGLRLVARTTQPPQARVRDSTVAPPDLDATIDVNGVQPLPLNLDSTLPVFPAADSAPDTPTSTTSGTSEPAPRHPMSDMPPRPAETPRTPEVHELHPAAATPPETEFPGLPELPPPPPLPAHRANAPTAAMPSPVPQPQPTPAPAPRPTTPPPVSPPMSPPVSPPMSPPVSPPAARPTPAAVPLPNFLDSTPAAPIPPPRPVAGHQQSAAGHQPAIAKQQPAVAGKPASPVAAGPGSRTKLLWGSAAAVVLALAAVALWWFWLRSTGTPAPATTHTPQPPAPEAPLTLPTPAEPGRPAEPALPTLLLQASDALDAGDVDSAETLLADFSDQQEGLLTERGCAFYDALRLAVADAIDQRDVARSRTLRAVERALDQQDFDRLRRLIDTADRRGLEERQGGVLQRARAALEAYDSMWEEHRQRNHLGILRNASSLLRHAPGFRRAEELRDQAATTLEAEAEQLAGQGRYPEAVYRLDALREHWPDRPGLGELEARMDQQQLRETRIENLITEALAAAARGRPTEGMDILNRVDPTPRFRQRYQQAAQQLLDRLEELDGAAPMLRLRGGEEALYFDRNQTAVVELTVTDDYEVRAVQFLARQRGEGGAFRSVPLRPQGPEGQFRAEIPASMHNNATVEFYVLAEDSSGHQSRIGSASEPVELRRKNWLRRLRDGD